MFRDTGKFFFKGVISLVLLPSDKKQSKICLSRPEIGTKTGNTGKPKGNFIGANGL
jgi:hypothetical protein